jgi:hypothetical protein
MAAMVRGESSHVLREDMRSFSRVFSWGYQLPRKETTPGKMAAMVRGESSHVLREDMHSFSRVFSWGYQLPRKETK